MIGGLDEAGRGPVIGPLVVAGIKAEENEIKKWADWGVKDSKRISAKKRVRLYHRLIDYYSYSIAFIQPEEIDAAVMSMERSKRLNYLEARTFARVIDTLKHPKVTFIVDACDTNATRFGNLIYNMQGILPRNEVISKHHADRDYTVVGAASIIAKVERDMKIEQIKKKFGIDFGSGYPSDHRTRAYLKTLDRKNLPPYVRKTWRTWQRL